MKWGPPRRSLTTGQREALYETARGGDEFPSCNICLRPVRPGESWVESHMPVPRALDGTATGIAHKRCNDKRWREVEAPMIANAKRKYKWARGIKVSRRPMRGGKNDPWKRTMDGRIVDRVTGEPWGQKKDG